MKSRTKTKLEKTSITILVIQIVLMLFFLVGEVKCIIKAVNCDWDPVGKSEIIYTAAACTGVFGGIVGWINIEDTKEPLELDKKLTGE